jgi:APA family basic amino acid/polyamine antiporter
MAERHTQGPGSDAGLFVRQATGLVREAGLVDTVFFNWVSGGAVGLALVYNVYWALNAFPGVNLTLATLLVVPFAICAVLVFALLAASMPRSGGDYVFVSRIVHPVWGFVSSWTGFVSVVAYNAWVAWFAAVAFVPAALGVMAEATGSRALLDAAAWAAGRAGSLIIGASILVAGGLVMAAGLRIVLRAITILAIVGLVGLMLSALVLLLNDRQAFVNRFNDVAAPMIGTDDAYGRIISLAEENGLPAAPEGSAPFSSAVLPTMVIAFYAIGYCVWSIYYAGEFKGARERRRQLLSMLLPTVLNLVVFVVMYGLVFSRVGYEFVNAASYLYNYVPDQYPLSVPPFVPFFASILAGNPVLSLIMAVAWVTWPIAMVFLIMVGFSRLIFAWSFDGVMPRWLSDVSARTHAPVRAILASVILSLVALVLLLEVEAYLTFLAYTVLLALTFWASMAIAGILLPLRQRDVYLSGPARWEIGGLPVVSLAGAVLLAFVIFELIMVFRYEGLGIMNRGQAVAVYLAVIGIGLGLFAAAYVAHRMRGRNLLMVFREIPPE